MACLSYVARCLSHVARCSSNVTRKTSDVFTYRHPDCEHTSQARGCASPSTGVRATRRQGTLHRTCLHSIARLRNCMVRTYLTPQPSRRSLSLHLSLRSSSITPRVRTSLTPDCEHATATRRCAEGNKDHLAVIWYTLPSNLAIASLAFWFSLCHSHSPLVCKQRERSPSSLYLDVSIVWTARRIHFVLFVRTILQTATILQQAVDVPRQ